jgi:hypothetical protein
MADQKTGYREWLEESGALDFLREERAREMEGEGESYEIPADILAEILDDLETAKSDLEAERATFVTRAKAWAEENLVKPLREEIANLTAKSEPHGWDYYKRHPDRDWTNFDADFARGVLNSEQRGGRFCGMSLHTFGILAHQKFREKEAARQVADASPAPSPPNERPGLRM